MFKKIVDSILGTAPLSVSARINKLQEASDTIAAITGATSAKPGIIVNGNQVTLNFGLNVYLNQVVDLNVANADQILAVGGTLAYDVFYELQVAGAIASASNPGNLEFVETLILKHPTLETTSIMFRDLPDSSSVNSVIAYLYNQVPAVPPVGQQTDGRQRLADLMLQGRRTNDIISQLDAPRLAIVLGKISDDGIARLLRDDSADAGSKFKLIQTMMNQTYDDNGTLKKCFNRALDGMNIQLMSEAMGKIMAQLGPNSVNNNQVHADVKDFVAQMVTVAATRGEYGYAAVMFNSIVATTGFAAATAIESIDNLIRAGKFAEIGRLLIGGATLHMNASNINMVFDHLYTQGNLQNVIDSLSANELYKIIDNNSELNNVNLQRLLTSLANTDPEKLGDLLMMPLNDNVPTSYGDFTARLVNETHIQGHLGQVLAEYGLVTNPVTKETKHEIAILISKFNESTDVSSTALKNVGAALGDLSLNTRIEIMDSFVFSDMARVVDNWSDNNVLAGVLNGNSGLAQDIVSQLKVNDWLTKLDVKWKSANEPSLTGLSQLSSANASWIATDTPAREIASKLIAASTHGVNIIKSAYVQEVLSKLGSSAFDFSKGINRDTIQLLAGVLVNDPHAFLNILGAVAYTNIISQDDCNVLNDLLTTTSGDNSIKLIAGTGWVNQSYLESSVVANKTIYRPNANLEYDPVTFVSGDEVTIKMVIDNTEIFISTSMTKGQKISVIQQLLLKYANGVVVSAADIANLFKAIANYGSGQRSEGTELLMSEVLDPSEVFEGLTTTLTLAQKNEIMYQLALSNEGQNFINTYVLTSDTLIDGMLDGFTAYCLDKPNGAAVLSDLLNTNFNQRVNNVQTSLFSNISLNKIIGDIPADKLNSVVALLDDHTLVALLNEDEVTPANKVNIRTSIIATRASQPSSLADIFNNSIAYRSRDGQHNFPNGIGYVETNALLIAINSSANGPILLANMLKEMTPAEVKSMLDRGVDGLAVTAVFDALNSLTERAGDDGSKGAGITAFLLTSNMTKPSKESLLSQLADPQLTKSLTNMTGQEVASLINETVGYLIPGTNTTVNSDIRIMELAKNYGLPDAAQLGELLLGLSVEGKDAFISILAGSQPGTDLDVVMGAMGADKVSRLVQTPGLNVASKTVLFQSAISALGTDGAVELLLMGEPVLSNKLPQEFLSATLEASSANDDMFNQLIEAVVDYNKNGKSGTSLVTGLISTIGTGTNLPLGAVTNYKSAILNSIATNSGITAAQKGDVLIQLATPQLMDTFMTYLNDQLDNVMAAMEPSELLALLETQGLSNNETGSWWRIMGNAAVLLQLGGPSAEKMADALVACLNRNNNPEFVTNFAKMIDTTVVNFPNVLAQISSAFERNWDPSKFATLALGLLNETTVAESDFRAINSLLSKIDGVDTAISFNSLKEVAETNVDLADNVQAFFREGLMSITRGLVNDPNSALGGIQAQAVLFAASQNLDNGTGSLAIFGSAAISVDSIVIAAENLYQHAPAFKEELANGLLQGIIGFDVTAGTNDAEYYNNIKRIAFIAQGEAGSLLSSIGSSPLMSSYLGQNSGMMTNSASEALSKIFNQDFGFIGFNGSSYYVKYTPISLEELGVINEAYGSNYADNYRNSYRALNLLSSTNRDNFGIIPDYTQDLSDWIFPTTINMFGDNGTPKVVAVKLEPNSPDKVKLVAFKALETVDSIYRVVNTGAGLVGIMELARQSVSFDGVDLNSRLQGKTSVALTQLQALIDANPNIVNITIHMGVATVNLVGGNTVAIDLQGTEFEFVLTPPVANQTWSMANIDIKLSTYEGLSNTGTAFLIQMLCQQMYDEAGINAKVPSLIS